MVASTRPVYDFTSRLCAGTDISVSLLVTESVSCLHDYTLQVRQMRAVEASSLLILSGGGMEEFLEDALASAHAVCDASQGVALLCGEHGDAHEHSHEEGHHHAYDPHIWLSPENAKIMAENICASLTENYPAYEALFAENLRALLAELGALQSYGEEVLSGLRTRELITFHDGFSYFAQSFDLTILEAIEEEAGSEASAADLVRLAQLVESHSLPAIFTEAYSSASAAAVIARETGTQVFALDMAMGERDYFTAMYYDLDTIREALG